MKPGIAFFVLLAACPAVSTADTYVRIQSHTDEYYFAGQVNPASDRTIELWLGGTRLAYVTDSRAYILDTSDSTLLFVNKDDSTYVQTGLPLDWSKLVSEETLSLLARYRRHGEVDETRETRIIDGWACRAYDVVSWIDVEDGRYDEREERIWVSKDPAVDWDLYRATRRDALRFSNYDDDLVDKMAALDGLGVLVEAKVYIRGFSVDSSEEVVRVEERTPPEGLYDVPQGFREKKELTLQDLRG